jgi:hypothetical protein
MQTDDEPLTTLSKWPFYLGDLLLVATALAIAILGDWQLTNWQVASCVIAVALGAALFVIPFILEFQIRVREESDDRSAELRVLARHIQNAEATIESEDERIRDLEAQIAANARSAELMTSAADQSAAAMDQFKTEQSGGLSALKGQLKALSEEQKKMEVEWGPRLAQVPSADDLNALGQRVEKLENAPAPTLVPPPPEKSSGNKESTPRPVRAPRERRKPEPRLLHRAIKEKQDSASSAVSRIIATKKAPPKVKEEPVPTEPPKVEASTPEPEVKSAVPAIEVPVEKVGEPSVVVETPVVAEPVADMFAEAVPPVVTSRARTKQADSVLTANIFIGIGNKPYLRGSGGGLNWEVGVVMDFEEIGKWRWVAPDDLAEPIELQIYRNDEDPDQSGTHTLSPGQKLEVSPDF